MQFGFFSQHLHDERVQFSAEEIELFLSPNMAALTLAANQQFASIETLNNNSRCITAYSTGLIPNNLIFIIASVSNERQSNELFIITGDRKNTTA